MPKKKSEKIEETLPEVDTQPGIEDDGLLDQLLTEEEIRQQMNAILRRMPAQRARLTKAFEARANKYARTWVGISLMDPSYLHTEEAKDMMRKFVERIADKKHKALTVPDKQALVTVDLGDLQTEYEVAEIVVKMDQEQYHQLNKQLQWYMNLKGFTGPTVPMGRNPISAADMIYKNLGEVGPDPELLESLQMHTREEIATMIETGELDPTPQAVDYAYNAGPDTQSFEAPAGTGPFETKVDELADQEGVPIHQPEHFTPDEVEQEPHWIEELEAGKVAMDPNDPKTPVLPKSGKTIGGIYGKETLTEFYLERDGKLPEGHAPVAPVAPKSLSPVRDAIERINAEKSTLAKAVEDPAALAAADAEVLGPRDDENDPNYVDPDPFAWMNKL